MHNLCEAPPDCFSGRLSSRVCCVLFSYSGEVTVEIPENLATASMLNQNTDTYNDYLGEFCISKILFFVSTSL